MAATALGLGAGTAIALSGFDLRHAAVAGIIASIGSAFLLRNAPVDPAASIGPRMGIVPWGVLVDELESPSFVQKVPRLLQ